MAGWRPLPRTIVGLVLTGLVAVTVPLAVGVGLAVNALSDITLRTNALMRDSIDAMRTLNDLDKDAVSVHRLALQFEEINDPRMVGLYRERLDSMRDGLARIASLDPERRMADVEAELLSEAEATLARIEGRTLTPAETGSLNNRGARLQVLARQLIDGVNSRLRERIDALQVEGENKRRQIFGLTLVLAPLTLFMVLVFSSLITRPIRSLIASIARLQRGELTTPVSLRGTPELVDVASQLDDLRARLLHLQNQRSTFFREVSHELKSPLATVRLSAELLQSGDHGKLNADQRDLVDMVHESYGRLEGLVENLLNFNGWEERHSEMSVARFELDALLARMVRRYELPMGRKRLRVERAPSELEVEADRAKLRVCIENLFSNAVKFAPPGSALLVRALADGSDLVVDIADQGPGVAAADRESIFEPFFQGAASRTAHEPGTGLGLSVARECARAHGGGVQVLDPEAADAWRPAPHDGFRGGYFRVRIPRALVALDVTLAPSSPRELFDEVGEGMTA